MLLKNWLYRNRPVLVNTPAQMSGSFLPVLLFVLLILCSKAQVNLVQNPSFENISSCPNFFGQINLAIGWDTLRNKGGGSPELFNGCANPDIYFGIPQNNFGLCYQIPRTGISYASMGYYQNSNFYPDREYIQNKLLQPLVIGKTYCVSFYVSLSNRSQYAIDELGAYFDNGLISSLPYKAALVNPQIKSPTGTYYYDTLNWMQVQGLYTAINPYTYITLGNFKTQAATNYTLVFPNNASIIAEYCIDDVSVIDVSTKAYAGNDTLICNGDSIFIGREPEIGLECQWFLNNQLIGSGAGMWVKPLKDEQYSVKQDLCGFITYDTINVSLKEDACYTLENTIFPTVFTPNGDGSNEVWYVNINASMSVNEFNIYNRWGNLITNTKGRNVIRWDGRTTAGEPCSDGVYFYILNYTDAKGETRHKKGCITLFR